MTEAERKERREAGEQADAALVRAREIQTRSAKIAAGWVKSRTDNNFRLMLRTLGQKAAHDGA